MTFSAWRTIFLTGSAVYIFGAVIYDLFIRDVRRTWPE